MIYHRTYLDNPKLITTRTHKPPIAKGHRSWLASCDTYAKRQDTAESLGPKDGGAVPKGDAQND